MDRRKKYEKDFHNDILDNNKREKVNRYYEVQEKNIVKLLPFLKRYCWTMVVVASQSIEN